MEDGGSRDEQGGRRKEEVGYSLLLIGRRFSVSVLIVHSS